jgi:hypothetical protein
LIFKNDLEQAPQVFFQLHSKHFSNSRNSFEAAFKTSQADQRYLSLSFVYSRALLSYNDDNLHNTSFPNLIANDEVYAVRAFHTWSACYLPVPLSELN